MKKVFQILLFVEGGTLCAVTAAFFVSSSNLPEQGKPVSTPPAASAAEESPPETAAIQDEEGSAEGEEVQTPEQREALIAEYRAALEETPDDVSLQEKLEEANSQYIDALLIVTATGRLIDNRELYGAEYDKQIKEKGITHAGIRYYGVLFDETVTAYGTEVVEDIEQTGKVGEERSPHLFDECSALFASEIASDESIQEMQQNNVEFVGFFQAIDDGDDFLEVNGSPGYAFTILDYTVLAP